MLVASRGSEHASSRFSPINLCNPELFWTVSFVNFAVISVLNKINTLPCFPYYNPGYYLKKNYFGVGTIKGKGLFKGGIIF